MVTVVMEFMTCFNMLALSSGLELKYEAGGDQNMQQSSAEKLWITKKTKPNQIHKELIGFETVQSEWDRPKPHQTICIQFSSANLSFPFFKAQRLKVLRARRSHWCILWCLYGLHRICEVWLVR